MLRCDPVCRDPVRGALLATPGNCKQLPSMSCGSVSAFAAGSIVEIVRPAKRWISVSLPCSIWKERANSSRSAFGAQSQRRGTPLNESDRRAWMSPWLNESQKAIESVLAVFTLGISSTSTSTSGKGEFVSQQPLARGAVQQDRDSTVNSTRVRISCCLSRYSISLCCSRMIFAISSGLFISP